MKTVKYLNLFRCDYKNKTVIAPTRTEAMMVMLSVILECKK